VSPRAGATWKVNSSGKTVVKGYYGLLYRGIFLNDFTAAIPSVTPKFIFDVTPSGGRTNFSVVSSNQNLTIDHGYKDPYSHEAIFQVEQELANNLGLQVNYVYKRGYDYPGWQDVGGRYAQVPYIDNQGVAASGQTINVFRLLTPFSQSVFQMTNVAGLFSRYNGVTITGTKRMSNNWQGTLSLVLSKSEGREPSSINGPASAQTGTSGTFGTIGRGGTNGGPNDFVNTDALLIGDRPVVAKAQLIYRLPYGFQLSGNLQHQTGRPWARQIRVGGLNFPSRPTIYMEPLDGSRRVPSLDLIDARIQKTFHVSNTGTAIDLFIDALNLTDTDVSENVLSRRGDQASSFGVASRFVYPRRLQLGARIKF